MAFIHIPKPFTETIRHHACNAINLLIQKGQLDQDISYDFFEEGGKTWVRIWKGDLFQAIGEGRCAQVDIRDVIAGASNKLSVIEGKSDSF